MSEFISDIDPTKKYNEDGEEVDKQGFRIRKRPTGVESVRIAVKNCENLCGLERTLMERISKGEFVESTTLDHSGRTSKKITIEYDIQMKE